MAQLYVMCVINLSANFSSHSPNVFFFFRLVQLVTVSGTGSEFRQEIATKGNPTCDRMIFGISRLSSACHSMYIRGTDLCETLETLPDEESRYVKCSSGGVDPLNGTLMVMAELDEHEWALCPLRLA